MTQLIVALDTESRNNLIPSLHRAGVSFFKLGIDAMMAPDFGCVLQSLKNRRCDWFMDAKIYDTRDTVERVARRAFDLGARFLTVHATPSMLEAAMRARPPGDYCKVLAVDALTDGAGTSLGLRNQLESIKLADGYVCSVKQAAAFRSIEYRMLLVCPGIRPIPVRDDLGHLKFSYDNHTNIYTPSEAKAAGADYVVVGRPIYDAPDPVAAARAIMEELR